MWQDIESVLLDEGPNACAATAGHPSGGDPLAYHHYHAIHHPIAAHQMSLVHPGFQQHPINHQVYPKNMRKKEITLKRCKHIDACLFERKMTRKTDGLPLFAITRETKHNV